MLILPCAEQYQYSLRKGGETLPKTKDRIGSGLKEGAERIRAQFREAAGQNDSPEGYGGDKIEAGAKTVSDRAAHIVHDVGGAIKDKAMRQRKDRTAERVREREPVDEPVPHADGCSFSQTPEADHYDTGGAQTTATSESRTGRSTPRQRPKPESKIKTKAEYIRSQGQTAAPADDPLSIPGNGASGSPKSNAVSKPAKSYGRSVSAEKTSVPKSGNMKHGPFFRQSYFARATHKTASSAQNAVQTAGNKSIRTLERSTMKTVKKGAVRTIGQGRKTAVKAARRNVKVAERTVRTSVQAAQKAAQTAARAAQASARAAQGAAKAAVTAAKAIAKVTAAIIKALVAAVKSLVAAIAAGGWVAVVIILAVALVAIILCACFGVFASNEGEDHPMTAAIQEIDTGFRESIDAEIARLSIGDYDEISIKYSGDMDGDSDYLINWNDVIAVYAVRTTTDEANPMDVVEVTPEKIAKLKEVFHDMNSVEYNTEVIETEEAGVQVGDEGTEEAETHRKLVITVTVTSMDYLTGADHYNFTDDQREALAAMMEPQMLPMYVELIGIDLLGGYEGNLTDIVSGLPAGEQGTAIVEAVLTRLGHPYSQELRGQGNYVDCSCLVQWAYEQAGISLPGTSAAQAQYCAGRGLNVGQSELAPGDLVFWSKTSCDCGRWNEIHHVGVYVGDNMVVEASSAKGRVIMRELWGLGGGTWQVHSYGRMK